MLRALLVMLLGLAFVLTDGGPVADVVEGAVLTVDAGGDDCYPERPGASPEEGDCCDVDFGRCCASGLVAQTAQAPTVRRLPLAPPPSAGPLSPPLLHPRSTGPPPTPPPLV
jgi:hypothetical protein